jgi:hypothetical protein
VGSSPLEDRDLRQLAKLSRKCSRDASGFVFWNKEEYRAKSADFDTVHLLESNQIEDARVLAGHSRLITTRRFF